MEAQQKAHSEKRKEALEWWKSLSGLKRKNCLRDFYWKKYGVTSKDSVILYPTGKIIQAIYEGNY